MMTTCPICGHEITEDEEKVSDSVTKQEYHLSCHEFITDIIG